MTPNLLQAEQALSQAKSALQHGHRAEARWWAQRALSLSPDLEEAWLVLSIVASPRASLFYLKNALEINPGSLRARKGLHWAIRRERAVAHPRASLRTEATRPIRARSTPRWPSRRLMIILVAAAVTLCIAILTWLVLPVLTPVLAYNLTSPRSIVALVKPSLTPTPTSTFTPTPTFTPSPTPTNTPTSTPTPTQTPLPTETSTPLPTVTPEPTQPSADQPPSEGSVELPPGVGPNERWVDVNLTQQAAYAYEGTVLVNSFIVSTGTWAHPTVVGTFKIYVKYRFADMAGPGYYLPDVPYVMYFYQGYGLHGTYWHHNFGTPMSHGCVNFRTEDAGWLFGWASVGTVVHTHY